MSAAAPRSSAASPPARLRVLAGALLLTLLLPLATAISAAASAPRPSCLVPMACCAKGVCPLRSHAAKHQRHGPAQHDHQGHHDSPAQLRCGGGNDVPLLSAAAPYPPATMARIGTWPRPRYAHALAHLTTLVPPSALDEPELQPPDSRPASR